MKKSNFYFLQTLLLLLLLISCTDPTKEMPKNTNSNLSGIKLSAGILTPVFRSYTLNYTVILPNSITSIKITGVAADDNARVSAAVTVNNLIVSVPQIVTITVTSEDGSSSTKYTIEVIRAGTDNADLFDIKVDIYPLNPTYTPSTTTYTVSVPNSVTKVTVSGIKFDPESTITEPVILNDLKVGIMKSAFITVKSQDSTVTKIYTVEIIRAAGSNADLDNLSVSEGTLSPDFASEILNYSVSVPNTTENIIITGNPLEVGATLSTNNGIPQILSEGDNNIIITVTAADGITTRDYTITVNRSETLINANLSALEADAGTLNPVFTPSCTNYTLNVPFDITSVTISGTKALELSKISEPITLNDLIVGISQTATITVTSQDDITIKNYIVVVTREEKEIISTNASLSALIVNSGILRPAFTTNQVSYSLIVSNSISNITIKGTTSDPNATLSSNNDKPLNINVGNNVITIKVTAQDGVTTKSYVVNVIRYDNDYDSIKIGKLKFVPAGAFQRDGISTNTSIVDAFRISDKQITRTQFKAIMGVDPSYIEYSSGMDDPVQNVNWYHAIAFCNKLSTDEGLTPVYTLKTAKEYSNPDLIDFSSISYNDVPINVYGTSPYWQYNWNNPTVNWEANGYRLPTEMEWMWAAMGANSDCSNGYTGTGINTTGYKKSYAGSLESGEAQENISNYAWHGSSDSVPSNSYSKTHPVGNKLPNELGIFDMSGNVWEHCWDWYEFTGSDNQSYYENGELDNYQGPNSSFNNSRVLRGASWLEYMQNCALSTRSNSTPHNPKFTTGFRVVRR